MARLVWCFKNTGTTVRCLQKCSFLSVFPSELASTKFYCVQAFRKNRNSSATNRKNTWINEKRHYSSESNVVKSPLGPVKPIPPISLVEYVYQNSEQHLERPATTCGLSGRTYTYGLLRMLINRFAKALLGHCGLKPRDVIGVLLPNIPEYVIAVHGALEAGVVVTFVNPLYTPDELKRQFDNASVKMIVTIPQLLEVAVTLGSQLTNYKGSICVGGEDDPLKNVYGLESLLTANHEADLPPIYSKELAILPYSSGTTGLPKGVMLSHYNLVANLVQNENPEITDTATKAGAPHTVLSVLPFFHIFGFNGMLNIVLRNGGHIINIPRFTPDDYIKVLVEYKPTFLFVVPTLLLFLATHPDVTAELLSSVETIQSGAAPLNEGLLCKFRDKCKRDINVRNGYGMTESSPVTLVMPKLTPPSKINTVGIPLPGTEAKIISLTTGETLPEDKSGELLVRGPQLMMGYLNNEQATSETIDKDGWLHTGDVAYYDKDNYFFIVDRTKELIKVKGNQVSPTELENIILQMPDVADVAVVGVPDPLAGELPKAFIVKKPDSGMTQDDVFLFVNPKVVHYKKIVSVKFIKQIPKNPSGKILRNILKTIE